MELSDGLHSGFSDGGRVVWKSGLGGSVLQSDYMWPFWHGGSRVVGLN